MRWMSAGSKRLSPFILEPGISNLPVVFGVLEQTVKQERMLE